MSSPQMPFFVYEVSISFRVIKDDLHKFIAILPHIQESRCSRTLKSLHLVVVVAVFVKFQMVLLVNCLHCKKFCKCEDRMLLYRKILKFRNQKYYMQMRLVMQIDSFWYEKDVKEPFLNFRCCFQFDEITLKKVLLVLDQPCVCVSIEPYYRNKPLVCG